MKFIYYIFLLLLPGLAWGQDTQLVTHESISRLAFVNPTSPGFGTFSNVDRTEGNPFLGEDWQKGRIQFEKRDLYTEDLELLINLEEPACYVRLSTGYTGEFPLGMLDLVEVFESDGSVSSYKVYDLKKQYGTGKSGARFYKIIHKGKYTILQLPFKFLQREKYIENVGIVRRPDKYEFNTKHYITDGQGTIQFKRNLKGLQKVLPEHASKLKSIVKKNDLNLKKDRDLSRLFELLEAED